MNNLIYRSTEEGDLPVAGAEPPVALAPGSPEPMAPAEPPAEAGCRQRYVNQRRNSRLATPLPEGEWSIRWETPLDKRYPADSILCDQDRILIHGPLVWQLFDAVGKSIASGPIGLSDVVLDHDLAHFHRVNPNGFLVACRQSDGVQVWRMPLSYHDNFYRGLIGRVGRRMVIVGTERFLSAHEDPESDPHRTIIEINDLGEPLDVHESGLLLSARSVDSVVIESLSPKAALGDDQLVVSIEKRIYLFNADLKIVREITGELIPVALSLDEEGRIHLVAVDSRGARLMVISTQGESLLDIPIGLAPPRSVIPPIIGYDHGITLLIDGELRSFGPDGAERFRYRPPFPPSGAVVLPDNRLLVSAGPEISVLDPEGVAHPLHSFEGETIQSSPVLTADGALLVTTGGFLRSLGAA